MPHRQRRIFLFLTIVMVPGAMLLAAMVWLVRQERELFVQRRERERELAAGQLGQELQLRLERLRADATNGDSSAAGAVVLTARATGDVLRLPWQLTPRATRTDARMSALLDSAARAEFIDARYAAAAQLYERAAHTTTSQTARADAQLLAARAHVRGGDADRAATLYRALAELDGAVRDADGLPYAVYAADALLHGGAAEHVQLAALYQVASALDVAPEVFYAIRELSTRVDSLSRGTRADSAAALAVFTNERLELIEQALGLARDFATLRAVAAHGAAAHAAVVWLPFGPARWLVSVPTRLVSDSTVVLAVDPGRLLAQLAAEQGHIAEAAGAAQLDASGAAGPALGAAFPGTTVRFATAFPSAETRTFGTTLLLFAVPVVLGLLAFTVYLLWRDVRREVAAAALRSHFVSSVSHELKTPLTAIRMFAEMLRYGHAPPERATEYLGIISNETERLTRLINNVLDFSRIERAEREYRREPTALSDVVRDAARTMTYPLTQDGFDLQLVIDDTVPAVRADRDAIAQAVLNLLSNAIKFSGTHRTIALTLGRENGSAVIRVADQGMGIEPEDQRSIFEKYYRSAAAEAAGIPGTGLGLALVAHVAHGHGGRVTVDSVPGRGSTFSLVLPLEDA